VKRVGGQREDPILGWRGPRNSPQRGGGGGKLSDGGGGGWRCSGGLLWRAPTEEPRRCDEDLHRRRGSKENEGKRRLAGITVKQGKNRGTESSVLVEEMGTRRGGDLVPIDRRSGGAQGRA
jgi:hypothetical protein